jgi:hypothetical protein
MTKADSKKTVGDNFEHLPEGDRPNNSRQAFREHGDACHNTAREIPGTTRFVNTGARPLPTRRNIEHSWDGAEELRVCAPLLVSVSWKFEIET